MDAAERELTLAWIKTWQEAGPALEAVKRDELRALTAAQALFLADALLDIASRGWHNPERERWSGLVEQQALFRSSR